MIGIIGGTGLYQIDVLTEIESRTVETPYGAPSGPVLIGTISSEGRKSRIAFLPRHGIHHQLLPSEINFRANIWALKSVGVRQILSVSAVGSLTENIRPGDLALPDQYLDFTKGRRAGSFFGDGLVAHISTAEPSCHALAERVMQAAHAQDVSIHRPATYACVEGPRLGTRAESFLLRNSGCHLVGMTNVPEVFLAREAQLCYTTIAVVTDYDCWLDDPSQHATVDKVIELYKANLNRVQAVLRAVLSSSTDFASCTCAQALNGAVMTSEESLSDEKRRIIAFLRS